MKRIIRKEIPFSFIHTEVSHRAGVGKLLRARAIFTNSKSFKGRIVCCQIFSQDTEWYISTETHTFGK